MRLTDMICPDCSKPFMDVRGLGEKSPKLICSNNTCSGKYPQLCEKCGSKDKDIQVRGLGHQVFTCKECHHQWSSI